MQGCAQLAHPKREPRAGPALRSTNHTTLLHRHRQKEEQSPPERTVSRFSSTTSDPCTRRESSLRPSHGRQLQARQTPKRPPSPLPFRRCQRSLLALRRSAFPHRVKAQRPGGASGKRKNDSYHREGTASLALTMWFLQVPRARMRAPQWHTPGRAVTVRTPAGH